VSDKPKQIQPKGPRPEPGSRPAAKVMVLHNGDGDPVAVPEDVVLHGDAMYRAYTARQMGKSWIAIAREEGYPSGHAIRSEVEAFLDEAATLVTQASKVRLLNDEVDRMDALQAAFWPQAMSGHVPSGQLVLAIVRYRSQLVGLEGAQIAPADHRTVVVLADQEGYLRSLQRAAANGA
jgi:hypothetical protein